MTFPSIGVHELSCNRNDLNGKSFPFFLGKEYNVAFCVCVCVCLKIIKVLTAFR